MTRPTRPIYRDDGRTQFCRLCQCSILTGVERQHERQEAERHKLCACCLEKRPTQVNRSGRALCEACRLDPANAYAECRHGYGDAGSVLLNMLLLVLPVAALVALALYYVAAHLPTIP